MIKKSSMIFVKRLQKWQTNSVRYEYKNKNTTIKAMRKNLISNSKRLVVIDFETSVITTMKTRSHDRCLSRNQILNCVLGDTLSERRWSILSFQWQWRKRKSFPLLFQIIIDIQGEDVRKTKILIMKNNKTTEDLRNLVVRNYRNCNWFQSKWYWFIFSETESRVSWFLHRWSHVLNTFSDSERFWSLITFVRFSISMLRNKTYGSSSRKRNVRTAYHVRQSKIGMIRHKLVYWKVVFNTISCEKMKCKDKFSINDVNCFYRRIFILRNGSNLSWHLQ